MLGKDGSAYQENYRPYCIESEQSNVPNPYFVHVFDVVHVDRPPRGIYKRNAKQKKRRDANRTKVQKIVGYSKEEMKRKWDLMVKELEAEGCTNIHQSIVLPPTLHPDGPCGWRV